MSLIFVALLENTKFTIDARIYGSMCRVVSRDLRFYCKPKMRQLFVIALRAVRYCSPNEGKKENAKEGNCILQGRRKVWKSGGSEFFGGHNLPPCWECVNWSVKIWGCHGIPPPAPSRTTGLLGPSGLKISCLGCLRLLWNCHCYK